MAESFTPKGYIMSTIPFAIGSEAKSVLINALLRAAGIEGTAKMVAATQIVGNLTTLPIPSIMAIIYGKTVDWRQQAVLEGVSVVEIIIGFVLIGTKDNA